VNNCDGAGHGDEDKFARMMRFQDKTQLHLLSLVDFLIPMEGNKQSGR
jgi:hypothetical protein